MPLPASKTDANPPTGRSYELDAEDINTTQGASNDLYIHVGTTFYNVKTYNGGLDPDGIHDDAPSITRAIAAAGGPGNIVVLNASTLYSILTPVTWNTQVGFVGRGQLASKMTVNVGSGNDAFTFNGGMGFAPSGSFWRDLQVACVSNSNCRDVLSFQNWQNHEMTNVLVFGGGRYGVNMLSVFNQNWNGVFIQGAQNAGLLIDGTSSVFSTTNNFNRCVFDSVQNGPGVDYRTCITTTFNGCTFTTNGYAGATTNGRGFKMASTADSTHACHVTLITPHFEQNYGYDFYLTAPSVGSVAYPGVVGLDIINPEFNAINNKSGASNGQAYLDGLVVGNWKGGVFNNLSGVACAIRMTANFQGVAFTGLPYLSSTQIEWDAAGSHTYYDYPGLIQGQDGITSGFNSLLKTQTLHLGNGVTQRSGSGSPAGAVAANPGSTWYRNDGSAGSTFYVKTSGTGTSGWTAVG